jgi:hypothetical protein
MEWEAEDIKSLLFVMGTLAGWAKEDWLAEIEDKLREYSPAASDVLGILNDLAGENEEEKEILNKFGGELKGLLLDLVQEGLIDPVATIDPTTISSWINAAISASRGKEEEALERALWAGVPWLFGKIGKKVGAMRARGLAKLRELGLGEVKLYGKSYNSGRKALENAGFVLDRTTESGRRVFRHPRTGAEVYFDSGGALGPRQKPHWHIKDKGGQSFDRGGRPVESDDGAAHIPGAN